MKKYITLTFILVINSVSAQNWQLLDSMNVDGSNYALIYKDFQKNWVKTVEINYETGFIWDYRVEDQAYNQVDTQKVFQDNGKLAAYWYYPEVNYCKEFAMYDSNGVRYYEGAFYDSVRVGTWRAFDANGKVVTSVVYEHSYGDPRLAADKIGTIKVEENKMKDTCLFLSEVGYQYPYMLSSGSWSHKTYGVIKEIQTADYYPVATPFLFYSDGVTGWYPFTPQNAILKFIGTLEGKWRPIIYTGDTWDEGVGLDYIYFAIANDAIEKGDYVLSYDFYFCAEEDKQKISDFLEGEGLKPYDPEGKFSKKGNYLEFKTRSFSGFLVFYPTNGTFKKGFVSTLPDILAKLELFKGKF